MTPNQEERLEMVESCLVKLTEIQTRTTDVLKSLEKQLRAQGQQAEAHLKEHEEYRRDVQQLLGPMLRLNQKLGWRDNEDTGEATTTSS